MITMNVIMTTMIVIPMTIFRCATGEAWPDIMLAGIGGRPCDPKSYNRLNMIMMAVMMLMLMTL